MGEIRVENSPQGLPWLRSTPGLGLSILLAALLVTAVACPRDPARLAAPESTHVAAAQSLAFDRDWSFDEGDRRRLEAFSWSEEDLLLTSGEGRPRRYDIPLAYPLILAPIVWLAPIRGPVILNVLLLGFAVLVAARTIGRRIGRAALILITVCVFASVMYRSVFLIGPASLLAAAVAVAFHLVLRHEEPASHGLADVYRPQETAPGSFSRSVIVGVVIGLVGIHHPLYLLLALPAAGAVPPGQRRSGLPGLAVGIALALLPVGLTTGLWGLQADGSVVRLPAMQFEGSVGLTAWNALYFLIGRNVGVLPYFLPFVALLGLWKGGSRRSVLVLTVLLGGLAPIVFSPFNFYGGPAAVGNAWLIPWFVLLWFVPAGPLPRGWLAATALLAVPAMIPTWLAPEIEPVTPDGVYRHSAGRWHRVLPPETTQRTLPPGEVMGDRLWIRSLNLEARASGAGRWLLTGRNWVELQIVAPTELAAIHLQFGPQAEAGLEVRGAELGDMILLADGGVGFRLENLARKGLHPMWWTAERQYNYVVAFHMPMEEVRAQSLTLAAIAADLERAKP